jgi:hypothetical protein
MRALAATKGAVGGLVLLKLDKNRVIPGSELHFNCNWLMNDYADF